MPQASDELRAMFEDDWQALTVLEAGGWTHLSGNLFPPLHPTDEQWAAAEYLCDEWDWGLVL